MVRLQKFLSDAGAASRRAGEKLILEGRVTVNGKVIRELGTKVHPTADAVTLDGTTVRVRRKLYVALNKPRGFLCTKADPSKRQTVGELLPREWSNVYPVGRLDLDSEGLIFLTNDGDFCLKLTHPRYGVRKIYRVVIKGRVTSEVTKRIEHGIVDEGEKLKAQKAHILEANNSHTVLDVFMTEGRNREVRRLFESQGFEVEQLKRTQIGPIKLGELPVGKWRALTETEIKSLLGSL
jgi:23S rRNA pseudouridine2605 synthase